MDSKSTARAPLKTLRNIHLRDSISVGWISCCCPVAVGRFPVVRAEDSCTGFTPRQVALLLIRGVGGTGRRAKSVRSDGGRAHWPNFLSALGSSVRSPFASDVAVWPAPARASPACSDEAIGFSAAVTARRSGLPRTRPAPSRTAPDNRHGGPRSRLRQAVALKPFDQSMGHRYQKIPRQTITMNALSRNPDSLRPRSFRRKP
jgi:hypothetical protein